MHTDPGRARWQWGKPEQTANELLSALRVSPGEVRDRPVIRQIVSDLAAPLLLGLLVAAPAEVFRQGTRLHGGTEGLV